MSSGEACPGAARTRRAARTGGDQERLGHGTGEAGKARNHRAWWRETRVLRGVPYYSSAVAARSMRRLNAPPLRAPASRGLRQCGRGRSWNPKAKRVDGISNTVHPWVPADHPIANQWPRLGESQKRLPVFLVRRSARVRFCQRGRPAVARPDVYAEAPRPLAHPAAPAWNCSAAPRLAPAPY
ncbi:hypothetical protein PVAP13_3KG176908 [Panicum virgatum]|uniref:Uncharacterized protein n=1 Tax=Panicum virgatum TaxID=38727 RepID=A0A8T0UR83_PANVG|nr:hypothetical protein PVAP13_3KG176908 [Panicum virgatum]